MSTDTNTLIETQLNWRYATKRFDANKKISQSDWKTLEESLRLAPSSFGLQPWKFIIVKNPEIRAQLLPQSWNQTQIVDASHLVVIAAKQEVTGPDVEAYLSSIAKTRNIPVESLEGFGGMINGFVANFGSQSNCEAWTTRQAYIALGMLLSSAALLKIDSCPMEGVNPVAYDEILKLKDSGYTTKVVCALGYRSADDASASYPKVRYPRAQVIGEI